MAHFIDFKVGGFKVGSIDSSAGIFIGENLQYGWHQSSKTNQSSRSITGDYNYVEDATNQVEDPDLLDTWIQKPLPWSDMQAPSPALAKFYRNRKRAYRRAGRSR